MPELFICTAGDVIEQSAMAPRGRADELLHALIVAALYIVFDGFDVLAALGSDQPAEIMAGVNRAVTALPDEVTAVSVTKVHKISRQILVRVGFIFYLADPSCLVWKVGLRVVFCFEERMPNHARMVNLI